MAYRSPARELGPIERRFASPFPVRAIALFGTIFGLPGLALLSGLQSAPGQMFAGDRWLNGAIGLVLLGFSAVVTRMVLAKARLVVVLYSGGLQWRERGITRTIFWDEIASLEGRHTVRTLASVPIVRTRTEVYRIVLVDGAERIATSMLSDVDQLHARIRHELDARNPP
jgi:hypothetical protein